MLEDGLQTLPSATTPNSEILSPRSFRSTVTCQSKEIESDFSSPTGAPQVNEEPEQPVASF